MASAQSTAYASSGAHSMKTFDAIVIGLGGMGSSIARHLAQRGMHVLGLEQFGPAHANGSSHGSTRMIRQAYYEDPAYVPLLRRAYELWAELQATTAQPIWQITGGLTAGLPHGATITGSLRAATLHGIEHDVLSPRDAMDRFPGIRPHEDEVVIYEPTIGALFPERCVAANLNAAAMDGCEMRFGTTATSWIGGALPTVTLRDGEVVGARRIVVSAGPWSAAGGVDARLRLQRNTQHWFALTPGASSFGLPSFIVDRPEFSRMFYGFPDFGDGLKVAFHKSAEMFDDPAALRRDIDGAEVRAARRAITSWIPDLVGEHVRSTACTYTMTPDEHFIIGCHPEWDNVIVAAGFSGHGFKFCPVVGEIVADIVQDGATRHDIAIFHPDRFATHPR